MLGTARRSREWRRTCRSKWSCNAHAATLTGTVFAALFIPRAREASCMCPAVVNVNDSLICFSAECCFFAKKNSAKIVCVQATRCICG